MQISYNVKRYFKEDFFLLCNRFYDVEIFYDVELF